MKKNMIAKRVGALVLCGSLTAGALMVAAGAASTNVTAQISPNISVVVDGTYQTFYNAAGQEVQPIVYNGTTYLPIRALGDDIYGYYQPLTYNEFYKACAQFGGSLLNEDKTEFTINSPENVAAAQMMADRVLVTNVQPTAEQMGGMGDWDLFMSGRLGMIPTGIWAFTTFADGCDFAWDICVEPGGTQKATHFFSNALVVNAESEKKEAAATWINWLASSDAAAQIRIEAGWDLPAINDDEVLSGYLELTPPDNRQAVFDSLEYLTVAPIIEDYALMSDIITDKLSQAASGKISAQEALDQAQSECEAQISLE